jgi:HAD superfamily hydrolase (TIGR01509 family)
MIKLIIFDLDGVLVDAKELHYLALNKVLSAINPKFSISMDEHIVKYDGLPTKEKLKKLSKEKGLPTTLHNTIWNDKQTETNNLAGSIKVNKDIHEILGNLKKDGYKLCVASNSIRESVQSFLSHANILDCFDFILSNQDVDHPKPSPEIYLKCMLYANCGPKETVILEDSVIGRSGAINSGAFVCGVKNPYDVTYKKITNFINGCKTNTSWHDDTLQILIPMAGAGSRFQQVGYKLPKPLIEVHDKPMIQLVVENLNIDAKFIFLVQKQHYEQYNMKPLLKSITNDNCEVVQIDKITEGAACTTLLAKNIINNDKPLLIANSDQYIEWDSNEFMYRMVSKPAIDAAILSFRSSEIKWSYAKLNKAGYVERVAEKEVISNIATVGIYYWKQASDYVRYAEQMISKNIRVKNEFYVCPVFNQAIEDDKKIVTFDVKKMHGLGTPEDLIYFQNHAKI